MTEYIDLLPQYLIKRYKNWKENSFKENKYWYNKIAEEGQNPSTMIISCCDARLHVTSIFGADSGEFFIHRNIANLVPPFNPDGDHHGTSAALEYAVRTLKVSNIIIFGHSMCGGIKNGYYLCKGHNNLEESLFVDKWLNILEPAFNTVLEKDIKISDKEGIKNLEKESIKISINNLIDFPFVKNSLVENQLSLHGLWHNIGTGEIESLDPISNEFVKL